MDTENKSEEKWPDEGILYIISTPIGNDGDISIRALKSIRGSHVVVCEEGKVGGRFLHKYNISQKMELLNENNEIEKTYELIKLLKAGQRISLVSDCGTPILADPGLLLVQECIRENIKVVAVPGPTSIMTALVMSGFPINSFMYAGFMSREKSMRISQVAELAREPRTVVLLETPYRLMPLLEAFFAVIPKRRAYIGCNLTMPYETHHYGTFAELYAKFSEFKFKGEFVIVLEGNADSSTILIPESSSVENYDRPRRRDNDAPRRFDRDSKPRYDRDSKPFGEKRFDRGDKPSGERRFDRDSKPRFDRDSKPSGERRFDRDSKPRYDRDRKPFGEKRFDRGDKPSGERRFDRDSKPRFDRDSKPFGEKRFDRGDKPSGERRFDRDTKPRFDRDSKPAGDKKYGDKFKTRKANSKGGSRRLPPQ